ncbi:MAG: sulfatase-like hydrolase/transferase [candidate division WS1 bacterium]|jgi:choline-sulfatase|nr:sulfatase-like hydrolase/transferase [candidate division WS1 bacterium]
MRLLFLDLDTLRADHLGCYGYHRNTSPNLDEIARQGVRFDNYHCSDAPCLPSRAALLTGQFGIHSGIVGHGGTAADMRLLGRERGFRDQRVETWLPNMLRRAGYRTVSVSPFAERHSAWWWYAGFLEMYNPGRGGLESAEEVTPLALDWITRHGAEDNWFLHVNYWDPHTPYRAPLEFGNPFAEDPLPEWMTAEKLAEHRTRPGPHGAWEIGMYDDAVNPDHPRHPGQVQDLAGLRQMFDGYDCGVRYMDEHIGRLLSALEEQGALEDLAIIVTADHGENLAELGLYGEHATADEITTRIPMLIRWPDQSAGHVDTGFHYNLDLLPTLAELLELELSESWDGQSYALALRGEECGREDLVVSQCAHGCQRSVRFGPWLYMRTYHDFYFLWPQEMLFNLAEDPHEERNLAEEHPELCREGAHRLQAWHDQMMATMPEGYTVDPMRTVLAEGGPLHARGHLPQYCERLEATGRGWAIPELKRRHPGEFSGG